MGVAKFDLSLDLRERRSQAGAGEGISGVAEYSTDLFDRETVEGMCERLQRLLEAVVENGEQRIGAIELLSEGERRQVVEEWNATATAVPGRTLPGLIEEQVARTPEAIAVRCQGAELSYGELNGRANRLAHQLIAEGIGPEDIVALSLPRSLEMVVGLLAVLKSGAAYLPVDPEYPAERVQFMTAGRRVAGADSGGGGDHALADSAIGAGQHGGVRTAQVGNSDCGWRGLPGRTGGALVARTADDQCLRTDGGHGVHHVERAAGRRGSTTAGPAHCQHADLRFGWRVATGGSGSGG